jgi:hypothetical protein
MSIISYFIPFLYMFAALIRVQREPARADVMRVPGGKPMAVLFGALGFVTTAAAIVLACVPAADEPNKELAVVKIIGLSAALVVIGAVVYLMGQRRALAHSSQQGLQ